ncbi:MAG TPA: universal stress protein, partial [Micromonosporaceae bacterium]|nr:universal stress protein [Micromonosporaceae bacterium]
ERYPEVDVRRLVVRGRTARVLIDATPGAALLVVGARGHGGFAGLLLGSVSRAVLQHAPCPVAIVHRPVRPRADEPAG